MPFGFGFQRGGNDGIALGLAQDRLASPTGLDFPNCRDALAAHALSPQRGRMTIDVVGSRNFQILLAGCRGQDQTAAQRYLLRRSLGRFPTN